MRAAFLLLQIKCVQHVLPATKVVIEGARCDETPAKLVFIDPDWRFNTAVFGPASKPAASRRYRVELITAESEASLFVRHRRLIRFPQLTMPLLAAWTPPHWE